MGTSQGASQCYKGQIGKLSKGPMINDRIHDDDERELQKSSWPVRFPWEL